MPERTEADEETPRHVRVELGEFFLLQLDSDERWAFGRGREVLLTGLSAEEAFLLVQHLRSRVTEP